MSNRLNIKSNNAPNSIKKNIRFKVKDVAAKDTDITLDNVLNKISTLSNFSYCAYEFGTLLIHRTTLTPAACLSLYLMFGEERRGIVSQEHSD